MSTLLVRSTALALLLCALLPQGVALAANYAVSPLLIDHTLKKRDIIEETLTITNRENRVIRLYASVNEVAVGSGGEIREFVPPSMSDNAVTVTSWVEITRGRIELQPGETIEVPLTIRINPTAEAGEYHAYIGFGDGSNRDDAEAKVLRGEAPGVIVRLSLDEERHDFLRLSRFFIDRFVTDTHESTMRYDVENPSSKPIVPGGEAIFYDGRGREVGALPLNPEGRAIAPGETASFEAAMPHFESLGRHKAFLSLEYGETQLASIHDTAYFQVVPLRQLLIAFTIVLLLAGAVTYLVSRRYATAHDDGDPDAPADVALFDRRGERRPTQHHDLDLTQ